MQIKWAPGDFDLIFFMQSFDPNLAEIAPRSKEIREYDYRYRHNEMPR
jgi:hypothetical protein